MGECCGFLPDDVLGALGAKVIQFRSPIKFTARTFTGVGLSVGTIRTGQLDSHLL